MGMTLDLLKQMARAMAVQFGSDCEIVIHDLTRKSLDKSIVYIENGQVTNRQAGDGPSRIVLEALKKDPNKISDHLGYLTRSGDGRILKSSTIFVRETEGGPISYIFAVNYDITNLMYFKDYIQTLICDCPEAGTSDKKEPEKIQTNVADILDELIAQSVALVGKPASLMTKNEKIEAIRFLNESGAFLITKSGDKVSQYFGISKYTLYSYIKADPKNPD
ncbi:MAG: helix-turn-helix transcriptional regulator [Clostridiales bacterium]|nr:helix-turn-helix transcriptional regulator [Clostridiales bacterium]